MSDKIFYNQLTMFIIMFIIGITLNPMNVLVFDITHIYASTTLIYSGLLMASNMIWAHEIVHYFQYKRFNATIFIVGILLSLVCMVLLRFQTNVNGKEWLKRMITHHSTALTTSNQILNKTNDENIRNLARNIINTQNKEINIMKQMISK